MSETLYLAHHGIKGMRWGVRRFQEEDGTLTEAGKKRYADYMSLNRRDRAAYRRASKAYGRADITREEIKDARVLSKRDLKKLKKLQDEGMSLEKARAKVRGHRAAVIATVSAATSANQQILYGKILGKDPSTIAIDSISSAVETFGLTFVGAYGGFAISDFMYERFRNRHGVSGDE